MSGAGKGIHEALSNPLKFTQNVATGKDLQRFFGYDKDQIKADAARAEAEAQAQQAQVDEQVNAQKQAAEMARNTAMENMRQSQMNTEAEIARQTAQAQADAQAQQAATNSANDITKVQASQGSRSRSAYRGASKSGGRPGISI